MTESAYGDAEDDAYRTLFDALLEREGLADPRDVVGPIPASNPPGDSFDEPPLWSRYDQLGFLRSLTFEHGNRLMIRAAVRHLRRLVDFAEEQQHPQDVMVTIAGWLDANVAEDRHDSKASNVDGTTGWLCPCFWVSNPDVPTFTLFEPDSMAGEFVVRAVDGMPGVKVRQGRLDRFGVPAPARVFVIFARSTAQRFL